MHVRYLDLSEVNGLADELVVFGQLLAGWELDEDLAQLAAIAAVRQGGGGATLGYGAE